MLTDPISDMLTTIRNGQNVGLAVVSTPASKMRENVLNVLKKEGYIRDYKQKEVKKNINRLEIELKYHEGVGAIKEVWRISKPGLRVYKAVEEIQKVRNGLGISILSTSKGIMSDSDARRENVGGEVLCGVF